MKGYVKCLFAVVTMVMMASAANAWTLEVGMSRQTFTGDVYVDDDTLRAYMMQQATAAVIAAGVPVEMAGAAAAAVVPSTDSVAESDRIIGFNVRNDAVKKINLNSDITDEASVIYSGSYYNSQDVSGTQIMVGWKTKKLDQGFDFFTSLSVDVGTAYGEKSGFVPFSIGQAYSGLPNTRISSSIGYNTTAYNKAKESDYKLKVNPWVVNAKAQTKINEQTGIWAHYETISTLGVNKTVQRKSINLGVDYGF